MHIYIMVSCYLCPFFFNYLFIWYFRNKLNTHSMIYMMQVVADVFGVFSILHCMGVPVWTRILGSPDVYYFHHRQCCERLFFRRHCSDLLCCLPWQGHVSVCGRMETHCCEICQVMARLWCHLHHPLRTCQWSNTRKSKVVWILWPVAPLASP